jgi:soluble lytic murein transglycosylase-like protein
MARNRFVLIALGCALSVFAGSRATADLVLLRNGRTLPVSEHRLEGDRMVLIMDGGGVITLHQDLVAEVRPEPAAAAGEATARAGGAEARAAALESNDPPPPGSGSAPAEPADDPIRLRPGEVFNAASLRDLAGRVARRHGVSETLVRAVIEVESRYDAFAVSPRGAMGLMQLMPGTAARFAVKNAFDPVQNVDGGVRYLRELLQRYGGELRLALAAYNAGEEAVDRYGGIPPYRETRQYVVKVLRLLGR